MKRKLSIIILLTLFLSSCGIPTVYNFDSLIDLTFSNDNKTLTVTFDNTNADKADAFKTINTSNSPSIIYFYTITSKEHAELVSLKSEFKKLYVGDNKFGTPIIVPKQDSLFSVDNGDLKFYVLNKKDNNIYAPTYSEKLNVALGSVSPTKTTVDIPISYDLSTKILMINSFEYNRFNNTAFSDNTANLTEYYEGSTNSFGDIYLNIYAAVNAIGDFSNIYWTELHEVTSIDLN